MDIRQVSVEEKRVYIDRVKYVFDDLRDVLKTLEKDMESEDLKEQASAVWISGNLCTWYHDFMTQIKAIEKSKTAIKELQEEMTGVETDARN